MTPRKCKGTTKAGKPCGSPPLRGSDFCLSHSPEEERESRGFGGAQEGSGRPPAAKPLRLLRERVEEEIDKWLAPFEDALSATQGVVVGNGPSARLEILPDHRTRMSAAEAVFDRVYGRPRQTTELVGDDLGGGDNVFVIPDNPEWHERVTGVLTETAPGGSNGASGNGRTG
jgi:hypothetical protein